MTTIIVGSDIPEDPPSNPSLQTSDDEYKQIYSRTRLNFMKNLAIYMLATALVALAGHALMSYSLPRYGSSTPSNFTVFSTAMELTEGDGTAPNASYFTAALNLCVHLGRTAFVYGMVGFSSETALRARMSTFYGRAPSRGTIEVGKLTSFDLSTEGERMATSLVSPSNWVPVPWYFWVVYASNGLLEATGFVLGPQVPHWVAGYYDAIPPAARAAFGVFYALDISLHLMLVWKYVKETTRIRQWLVTGVLFAGYVGVALKYVAALDVVEGSLGLILVLIGVMVYYDRTEKVSGDPCYCVCFCFFSFAFPVGVFNFILNLIFKNQDSATLIIVFTAGYHLLVTIFMELSQLFVKRAVPKHSTHRMIGMTFILFVDNLFGELVFTQVAPFSGSFFVLQLMIAAKVTLRDGQIKKCLQIKLKSWLGGHLRSDAEKERLLLEGSIIRELDTATSLSRDVFIITVILIEMSGIVGWVPVLTVGMDKSKQILLIGCYLYLSSAHILVQLVSKRIMEPLMRRKLTLPAKVPSRLRRENFIQVNNGHKHRKFSTLTLVFICFIAFNTGVPANYKRFNFSG